MVLILNNIIV